MKVMMATKNAGKIEGARRALAHYYTDFTIEGIAVCSDVPDQPVNSQIYQGAKNRICNLKKYSMENQIEADLYLAVESGITNQLGDWMILNMAVLETKDGFESYGNSARFSCAT